MTTYSFTAFTEASLLSGTNDTNIRSGDTIRIPEGATTTIVVTDGDSSLSGDSNNNEHADDRWGQQASITDANGGELGNGGQIYAESYFWVKDQWGNWYVMIEIEQEGGSDDYFTFYTGGGYDVPPAGAVLTVKSECGVSGDWLKYNCLDGGDVPPPPTASVGGRLFADDDGDDTEWNADTQSWEEGVAGMTVTLYDEDDNAVATTVTSHDGTYKFDNLPAGDYYVKFTKPDGTDFVQKDVGAWGEDSDADPNGVTDVFHLSAGENKWNIDAGVETPAPATPALNATDDRITVTESEGAGDVETLDSGATSILANDTADGQPYAGAVVEVNGQTGAVGQWIDLDKGRVKINADGTVDFDANGDFEALNAGESEEVSVNYTIQTGSSLDGKLNYQFWNHVPNCDTIFNIPTTGGQFTGAVDDFDVNALALNLTGDGDTYKIRYTGFLEIKEGGSYDFKIGGDDGVGIWIDGELVASRDGLHGMAYANGSIDLSAGVHTVEIRFFEKYGDQGLDVKIKGPDTDECYDSILDHVGSEATGASDTATVTIEVQGEDEAPANLAPIAENDAFVTDEETAVSGNVLENDSDPDGDPISVIAVEGGEIGEAFEVTTAKGHTGLVTLNADGSFSFAPDASFKALNQGEQDSFELTYTISDDPTAVAKTNLLFVLDISNSTVGRTGDAQDVFSGVGVGDVNGDGLADTVLDAEIAAVISAVQKLLAEGVDPSAVDVGIVTFSGLVDLSRFARPYNTPTEDAAIVGTWTLDEAALIEALSDIKSGGWTNYEAGLQEAENWLAANADAGEANKVFFLSDGRPVIDKVNGHDVSQDMSDYGDEVARIAGDYGAEIHAIGVGGNSDLGYLNDIDNTGGAIQVLDANDLTVALEDVVVAALTDTATITVTINGLNEPPVATDDRFDTIEDAVITGNIVTGDNGAGVDSDPNGDALTVTALSFGAIGVATLVETNESGFEGLLTVNADGSFTFEPDEDLVELLLGETETVTFEYTIDDGNGATDTATVTIVVSGAGQPPVATANLAETDEGVTVTGNVITDDDGFGVDSDPDGDPIDVKSFTLADGASGLVGAATLITFASGKTGTLTLNANGDYSFAPGSGFDALLEGQSESYTLTYTLTDDVDGESEAELTITVNGVSAPPVADDEHIAIPEGGAIGPASDDDGGPLVTLNILEGDSDPDGATGTAADLTITSVGHQGGVGGVAPGVPFDVTTTDGRFTASVTVNADGEVVFDSGSIFEELELGEFATLAFDYTVTDADGLTADATVEIEIIGESGNVVTDPPSFNIFFMVDLSPSATSVGAVTEQDADFFRGGSEDLNGDGAAASQADAAFVAIAEFQAALQASGLQGDVDLGLGTFALASDESSEYQVLQSGAGSFVFELGENLSGAFNQAQGLGDTALLASAAAGANEFFAAAGADDPDAINLFYILSEGEVLILLDQQSDQVADPFGEITTLFQGLNPSIELLSFGADGSTSTLGGILGAGSTTSAFSREEIDQWALDEVGQILAMEDTLV